MIEQNTGYLLMDWRKEYRFTGQDHAAGIGHVIPFSEMSKWAKNVEYEVKTLCGVQFRPSWVSTMLHLARDTACQKCLPHIERQFTIIAGWEEGDGSCEESN